MAFRPCVTGCGSFLTSVDGHERCLTCLGREHAEAAFVDGSCAHCERMSMATLRSCLSFTRLPSSSSRGSSSSRKGFTAATARRLGDLQVMVQNVPPGKTPRASAPPRGPVVMPKQTAPPSKSGPSVSFGAPPEEEMSISASEGEQSAAEAGASAAQRPSAVAVPSEADAELSAMLLRAAEGIGLEVPKVPPPDPSRLEDWFLGTRSAAPPRSPPVPFFPEVHDELVRAWQAPYSACSRSTSSALATLDGGAARGYEGVPQVERAVAVHLCPQDAATWRGSPRLLSKACRLSSALTNKAYSAADQATTALHAMATLQVYQAKALKELHKGSPDQAVLQELRAATDFALRATKVTARSLGQVMSTLVVQEHHLWLNLAQMADVEKTRFLNAPVSQADDTVEDFAQQFSAVQKQTEAISHILPRRVTPSKSPGALPQPARRRGRPPAAPKKQEQPAPSPAEAHDARLAARHRGRRRGPLAVRLAAWLELPSPSRWLIRTVRLSYAIQFARHPPKFRGILFTSVRSDTDASVLRAEIAVLLAKDAIEPVPPAEMRSGFYSPYFIVPKKSGGLRPILDLRVLNRSLLRLPFKMLTSKRILSCVRHQDLFAAIDLKDAYFHVSILSRHSPFLRFAFEGRVYQYKVLPFGLSLSPRVFTKIAEGALNPLWQQGVRILNYLDDWLIMAHSREQLCEHRDLVLQHLSHLGLRVNREKSKLSPVQRISFLSMELDSINMTACLTNERTQSAQNSGPSQNISEAPGAYGSHSCSNAARPASYETASALTTRSSPKMGMAPWHTPDWRFPAVSPPIQPVVRPCLPTDRSSLRTGLQACCGSHRCLLHGLGCCMQRASSLGLLDGTSTALAHQLPGVASSASRAASLSPDAPPQARVCPYRQHCDRSVHQPSGWSTLPPYVATRPPSAPVESDTAEIAVRRSYSRGAQPCSRSALTAAHHPGEWRLHPQTVQLIWSRFGEAQIDLFASPESSHCQLYYSLSEAPLGMDALAHSWPPGPKYAFPPVSLLAQTLCKIREDGEQVLLVAPYWPTWTCPSLEDSPEEGPSFSGDGHNLAPASRSLEPARVNGTVDLAGLPQAVIETITQSRAPSTRQAYALRWGLFVDWCASRREDPQRCLIAVVLSFLQQKLERRLSPSTLKVYVAAIAAYHIPPPAGVGLLRHSHGIRALSPSTFPPANLGPPCPAVRTRYGVVRDCAPTGSPSPRSQNRYTQFFIPHAQTTCAPPPQPMLQYNWHPYGAPLLVPRALGRLRIDSTFRHVRLSALGVLRGNGDVTSPATTQAALTPGCGLAPQQKPDEWMRAAILYTPFFVDSWVTSTLPEVGLELALFISAVYPPGVSSAEVALNLLLNRAPLCPYMVHMLDCFEEEDRFILILDALSQALSGQRRLPLGHQAGQLYDLHHHEAGYACPPEYFVDFEYEAETTTVWSLGIVMYRTVCGRQPFTDQHDGLSFDSRVSTGKQPKSRKTNLLSSEIHSCLSGLKPATLQEKTDQLEEDRFILIFHFKEKSDPQLGPSSLKPTAIQKQTDRLEEDEFIFILECSQPSKYYVFREMLSESQAQGMNEVKVIDFGYCEVVKPATLKEQTESKLGLSSVKPIQLILSQLKYMFIKYFHVKCAKSQPPPMQKDHLSKNEGWSTKQLSHRMRKALHYETHSIQLFAPRKDGLFLRGPKCKRSGGHHLRTRHA
ncbi:Transposon Ty3-G Gag-Pol polyprotein [Labeo rohita]|uniref:ribonuclease H n=1 Tax=Labeo rohita TaxID=84645 RepID=A0ABQ8MSP7_LABRO|nr:Transposon Ty3-G Gag-Pol polyprotein [Labeo rohita]